jgi:hypothetical protein
MLPLGKCTHGKQKIRWTVKSKDAFRDIGSEDAMLKEVAVQLQECPQIYNLISKGLLMSFNASTFKIISV